MDYKKLSEKAMNCMFRLQGAYEQSIKDGGDLQHFRKYAEEQVLEFTAFEKSLKDEDKKFM